MKTFLDFLYEDDDEQWITTKGGHHVLIDPDSGEIKSGDLKGTNIKNFKKNANPKKQKALKKAFTYSNCTDAALNKTFDIKSPEVAEKIDKMRVRDFQYGGHRAKYAEKAYETLASGLEGSDYDKFSKEYQDAIDVFQNKEAMDISYEMDLMRRTKPDVESAIESEIEEKQNKIDKLSDTSNLMYGNKKMSKSMAKKVMAQRKGVIEKLEDDIKSLQDKKEKYDKWKDKVREAKATMLKIGFRYNRYKIEYPEEDDD